MDLPMGELYECEGVIKRITSNGGVLILREDGEEFWVPSSTIDDKSETYREGDEGIILIDRKIAIKKGMVED